MLIDRRNLSEADLQWGEMKARQFGVSEVVTDVHVRARILAQSAFILATTRDHKRRLGIPVPDEGTAISST